MLESLLQYDKELFLFLNSLGNETWDGFWMFYTNKVNWIPFYAVLAYLMYRKLGLKAFVVTLIMIVIMIAFTDQITNAFKYGFKRPRPCHESNLIDIMRLVKSWCGGPYGYFSGHASNSMSIAVFTGLLLRGKYKYLVFILLFWAALMAYSRVYIGVHYPLDIISGMTFGALSGFGFYKLNNYIQKRFKLE